MVGTAAETGQRLIAFVVPSTPEAVPNARFRIRAVLGFHGLGEYADDAAAITSELVTNAIQHVRGDRTETIGITLSRTRDPEAVTLIVSDSSPDGPATPEAPADGEHGRGLRIVEALSAHWGWRPEEDGKSIFATLAKETGS